MLLLFLTLSRGACQCREVLKGGAHPYASPVTVTAVAQQNTLHIEDAQYVFAVVINEGKKEQIDYEDTPKAASPWVRKNLEDLEMEQRIYRGFVYGLTRQLAAQN